RVNGQDPTNNAYPADGPTPVTVTMDAIPPQATIRYTLDSSTPQPYSLLYTGPVSVIPPAQVRAAAFAGGTVGYSPQVLIYLLPYYFLTNATPGGGIVGTVLL